MMLILTGHSHIDWIITYDNCCRQVNLTSTFKECWGWAWADYYCDNSSTMHIDFVYNMTQQCQYTRCLATLYTSPSDNYHVDMHSSKFSVAPMSIWKLHNSSTVSLLVIYIITQAWWRQIHRPLQVHCLSKLNLFITMCLYIYLPVFVDNLDFTADNE